MLNGILVSLTYGSAVPDLDSTSPISALLRVPSTVTSSRKLEPVTGLPDCDLVWPVSAELTEALAVVSATRTPIVAEAVPMAPVTSIAPDRVTVRYWAFGTPVRATVH